MSKVFFDTNILAYACDLDSMEKLAVSRELLATAEELGNGCLSTQVLQEFYVTCTKKLGMEALRAKEIMQSFRNLETARIEPEDIDRAIDGNILWRVSFWDALIVVTARKLNCDILYTEDLNHGQLINGVRIHNPYSAD